MNEAARLMKIHEIVEGQESKQLAVVKEALLDDDLMQFESEVRVARQQIDQITKGQLKNWRRLRDTSNEAAECDAQTWHAWNAKISYLNLLQGIIHRYSKDAFERYKYEWQALRVIMERIKREQKLIHGMTEQVQGDVLWMAENGQVEDLLLLQKVRYIPFNSEAVSQSLFAIAEDKMYMRLYGLSKKRLRATMETYRIFCPLSALQSFAAEVRIIETYPAFVIVAVRPGEALRLKQNYPIEKLESIMVSELQNPPKTLEKLDILRERRATMSEQVVRFIAPIRDAWKTRLEEAGAKVLHPIGRSALVIDAPSEDVLAKVRELEEVAQVDPYVPTIRLRPKLFEGLVRESEVNDEALTAARLNAATVESSSTEEGDLAIPGRLVANFFTRADRDRADQELERYGVRIASRPGETRLILDLSEVSDPAAALEEITEQPGLRLLEEEKIMLPLNDIARSVIGAGVVSANPTGLSLTGDGEVIAIADTGLDTGDTATIHPDFIGRIKALQSYPIYESWNDLITNPGADDGPADRFTGHGTHVAGSAVGNGQMAQALGLEPIRGMAPKSALIFQAVEQSPKWTRKAIINFYRRGQQPPSSGLLGLPASLYELFLPAYEQGARIHSNSWGGDTLGVYDSRCEDVDRFVWEHKDFLIVIAAGNSGRATISSQCIAQTSVNSPGTAKNCLTVGACENDRGGQFAATYGEWDHKNFASEPFKSDNMADSIDDIVAFSSRGPCETRRHKPDVIAPGTFILSTRSSQIANNHFGWAAYPHAKKHYMYLGGTSMATPLVAGGAALVRQYLRENKHLNNPSAALLKAVVIHSAEYLNYRYAHPASAPYVDDEQGWGRVNLVNVLAPSFPAQVHFIDEKQGLVTGMHREYKIQLTDSSTFLRATLAYSDYPGENLINNLNLMLWDPDGTPYVGNDFAGLRIPDSVNNVEGVVVATPKLGIWIVRVIASDVMQGPQDFALVLSGAGLQLV